MAIDVWDDSREERRAEPYHPSRFRRWRDVALFTAEVMGLVSLGGTFLIFLLSSMGFTVTGSGKAITDIRAGDVIRDSAIVRLQRQSEVFASRLDAVIYLGCSEARNRDRSLILPRECNRVLTSQEEGP